MSVGPLTPPHPPSSLSPPLLLLPSSPPSPYLVGTVGRTARRARAGREETLPLRTRLPASSPCLPTSPPPPSPLACHRARRDTLSSGSNPSYSNDMGGCYGGGEEGSCCLTPATPSPPKTTMATDLRRTRTSPSRPPPPSQHRSAGKGGGLIGLGWRKHSDAGGDGGGWAEQVARRSRGTAARKLITLSSSYSTPTHPRRRSQKGGEGLQGEAGRRGRQGDGWCLLTSPPRQRSTRGSNRQHPRHRRGARRWRTMTTTRMMLSRGSSTHVPASPESSPLPAPLTGLPTDFRSSVESQIDKRLGDEVQRSQG